MIQVDGMNLHQLPGIKRVQINGAQIHVLDQNGNGEYVRTSDKATWYDEDHQCVMAAVVFLENALEKMLKRRMPE